MWTNNYNPAHRLTDNRIKFVHTTSHTPTFDFLPHLSVVCVVPVPFLQCTEKVSQRWRQQLQWLIDVEQACSLSVDYRNIVDEFLSLFEWDDTYDVSMHTFTNNEPMLSQVIMGWSNFPSINEFTALTPWFTTLGVFLVSCVSLRRQTWVFGPDFWQA